MFYASMKILIYQININKICFHQFFKELNFQQSNQSAIVLGTLVLSQKSFMRCSKKWLCYFRLNICYVKLQISNLKLYYVLICKNDIWPPYQLWLIQILLEWGLTIAPAIHYLLWLLLFFYYYYYHYYHYFFTLRSDVISW